MNPLINIIKKRIKNVKDYFLHHHFTISLLEWTKNTSLPGFFGVSIYDVMVFLYKESLRASINMRANSLAFSFMLSFFPSVIVILTLIPYFPIQNDVEFYISYYVQNRPENLIPDGAERELIRFVRDLTMIPRSGLLSVSFVAAIFFASNGMMALMRGFDKYQTADVFFNRNPFQERLVALKLTAIIVSLFGMAVILIIAGNILIGLLDDFVGLSNFQEWAIYSLRWLVVIAFFYMGISFIYRWGPAVKRKFSYFSPGVTLATLLSIISSLLFSWYITNFGNYNELYGSLGVLIVMMLWVKQNSFILIVGFELNAAIAVNQDIKELDID